MNRREPLAKERRLNDLAGIGKAMLRDFKELGISSVSQLKEQEPRKLYDRLCELKGVRVDVCCLDVFTCAVAQAKDPNLPADRRNWWYWSRVRKGQINPD